MGRGAVARHDGAPQGPLPRRTPARNRLKVRYQTDYLQDPQTIAIGGTGSANARLFAGAKEAGVVGINFPLAGHGGYNKQLELNHFDLLIDWGWFYFITKPMFLALDYFYHLVGNFGVAILLVTVLVEAAVLPARQQVLRLDGEDEVGAAATGGAEGALSGRPPEAAAGDDGDLHARRRSIRSPVVFPVALQIPVFFSLYKVLFVTIEMRHAPFYGWIKDLSAPDPTTICSTCSDCCLSTRRMCRCSALISRSASGRSSWASRCGSR